jgi:hypothetical protein
VKCVLCNGNHPAKYKGCTVYKDLQMKTFPPLRRNREGKHTYALPQPHITSASSYATALKSSLTPPTIVDSQPEQQNTHRQQQHPPQTDIQELKAMMEGFMEQMGTMLNLLTTLVSKLGYMIIQLHITLWNANGLARHTDEIKTYLHLQNVDIMLISKTHFTTKSSIHIPNYSIYNTQHRDDTMHRGTAIIIKNNIKHHLHGHYNREHLQAPSVTIDDWIVPLTTTAVYCPPKHVIKTDKFLSFYSTFGHRFLAGGGTTTPNTAIGAPG